MTFDKLNKPLLISCMKYDLYQSVREIFWEPRFTSVYNKFVVLSQKFDENLTLATYNKLKTYDFKRQIN